MCRERYLVELQFRDGGWRNPFCTDHLRAAKNYISSSFDPKRVVAARITDRSSNYQDIYLLTIDSFVSVCLSISFTIKTQWNAREIYHSFTDQDRALARRWLNGQDTRDDKELDRMLSARGAEKAAQEFYRAMGYQVEDIAIKQPNGKDWETHDVLLNGKIPIDVKNARTSSSLSADKYWYADLCVPRFKFDRSSQDVVIAGVLSPYPDSAERSIIFLGETSKPKIQRLEREFSNQRVKITIERALHQDDKPCMTIPPWMFDYPVDFYTRHRLNPASLSEIINRQNSSVVFTVGTQTYHIQFDMAELLSTEYNMIPMFLAAGLPVQDSWGLADWQAALYEKLLQYTSNHSLSLPIIFLILLNHFLDMLVEDSPANYTPKEYRCLLFCELTQPRFPLDVYDPLNIIDSIVVFSCQAPACICELSLLDSVIAW